MEGMPSTDVSAVGVAGGGKMIISRSTLLVR